MLAEETRIVLDAAAVAGDSFEPELVAAIAERPAPVAALDELLRAELIRPTEVPRRFRFRHSIVRRAVYDDTARGWQLGAHARAAAALAAGGAPASARAYHVERSALTGDEEAIALLIDAARTAATCATDHGTMAARGAGASAAGSRPRAPDLAACRGGRCPRGGGRLHGLAGRVRGGARAAADRASRRAGGAECEDRRC